MKAIKYLLMMLLVLSFGFSTVVQAIDSATVGGNDIVANDTEIQMVPIYLKNNPGVMGYKISVEYPPDVQIKSISRGTLCESGIFNTSLETHSGNIIDIVWSGTENCKEDGSLFILGVLAGTEAVGKEIKLSYSRDDTFDELWSSVALFCVGLNIVNETVSVSDTFLNENEKTDKDYDYIKTLIETELENYNLKSLENIDKSIEAQLLASIKKELSSIKIETIDDIKTLYRDSLKSAFESETVLGVDEKVILDAIEETLKEINVNNIEDVQDANKKEFCDKVIEQFKESNFENDDYEKLSTEERFDSIKNIYNDVSESEEKAPNSNLWWIIPVIVMIIGIVLLVIFVYRKKR